MSAVCADSVDTNTSSSIVMHFLNIRILMFDYFTVCAIGHLDYANATSFIYNTLAGYIVGGFACGNRISHAAGRNLFDACGQIFGHVLIIGCQAVEVEGYSLYLFGSEGMVVEEDWREPRRGNARVEACS